MTGLECRSPERERRGRRRRGFVPPVYPYDKLAELAELAAAHEGGAVDLSVGTPCDPPPALVLEALATLRHRAGLPLLGRARRSTARPPRVDERAGSASTPPVGRRGLCRHEGVRRRGCRTGCGLRTPEHATPCCARCSPIRPTRWARSSPVPGRARAGATGRDDGPVVDLARGRCAGALPVGQQPRQPRRPARGPGGRQLVGALAARARSSPTSATWSSPGPAGRHSILEHGPKRCRRSPLAVETVEPRRASGRFLRRRPRISSGTCPSCASMPASWSLDPSSTPAPLRSATTRTSNLQRATVLRPAGALRRGTERNRDRRHGARGGSFYLWVAVPEPVVEADRSDQNPGWALTRWLAVHGGVLVTPGDTYGPAGAGHVRVALVQPDERLELVARRLEKAKLPR